MEKRIIGQTANGHDAYVIIDNEHMQAHADVTEELIAEAVGKIKYEPTFWMGTVDLERVIGKDTCVETTADDDVRMICRPGRNIESRMVFNREPEDTTLLTVGICTDEDDGLVTIFTAFPGVKAPKELNDPRLREEERVEAEAFWSTHALCATTCDQ